MTPASSNYLFSSLSPSLIHEPSTCFSLHVLTQVLKAQWKSYTPTTSSHFSVSKEEFIDEISLSEKYCEFITELAQNAFYWKRESSWEKKCEGHHFLACLEPDKKASLDILRRKISNLLCQNPDVIPSQTRSTPRKVNKKKFHAEFVVWHHENAPSCPTLPILNESELCCMSATHLLQTFDSGIERFQLTKQKEYKALFHLITHES